MLHNLTQCYQKMETRNHGFSTEKDALDHIRRFRLYEDAAWGLINFTKTENNHIEYKIVTHFGFRDQISTLYLQSLIESAVMQWKTGKIQNYNLFHKLLPKRCRKNPLPYISSFSIVACMVTVAFIILVQAFTSEICHEKASGLLEFLFIAGVPRWRVKLSWFLFGAAFFPTVAILLACIIKLPAPRFIEYTNFGVILGLLLLYSLTLICMCLCVSSLMATSQTAGVLIMVSLLAAYMVPSWFQLLPNVGYSGIKLVLVRILCIFHSSVAMQVSLGYIFAWEELSFGINMEKLNQSPIADDKFGGVLECIIYMIVQCPFYLFLSWYFDHVAPSKYGLKWPLWFCCLPSFWFQKKEKKNKIWDKRMSQHADIEMDVNGKPVGILVDDLSKHYGKKTKAVNHLSAEFYKNEVSVLLGHNGAGKSTTMNILTGMTMPSGGSAYINGKNIKTDMRAIRKTIGFCPQYDVIYPELTVKEHMHFYGKLRSLPMDEVELFYSDLFGKMKMTDALDKPAKALSGGMKRKLSIAISILGDPTVLILDEPTSAIDPFSRRAIWDIILKYKSKATVLISTHYMQEADLLGDRIIIIDKGMLRCSGSPLYLKSKYGSGITLHLAHRGTLDQNAFVEDVANDIKFNFKSTSDTGSTYTIPSDVAKSSDFIALLENLDTKMNDWGISSYGIAEATMEQVFFIVAEGGEGDVDAEADSIIHTSDYEKITGCALLLLQVWACWIKRFYLAKRSFIGFVFQILTPLLFTIILFATTKTLSGNTFLATDSKMIDNSITDGNSRIFYSGQNSSFLQSLLQIGFGSNCVIVPPADSEECLARSGNWPDDVPTNGSGVACDCSKCPVNATEPEPNMVNIKSREILYNLNRRNISEFLLKYKEDLKKDFKGGIESKHSADKTKDSISYQIWAGVSDPTSGQKRTKEQSTMKHMKAAFLNAFNNIMFRTLSDDLSHNRSLTAYTEEQSMNDAVSPVENISGLMLGFFATIALMMPIFNVVLVIVTERSSGNKQLQYLMGLNKFVYWFSNFVWDLQLYTISALLMIVFMSMFPNEFDIHLGYFFVAALFYGISMILTSYVLSFALKKARTVILLIGNIAPLFSVAAFVLLMFKEENWYDETSLRLYMFPPYFLTDSLIILSTNDRIPEFARKSLLHWNNLAKGYTMISSFILLMTIIIFLAEIGYFKKLHDFCCICCEKRKRSIIGVDGDERDPDVTSEEERVLKSNSADKLVVKNLAKAYDRHKAAVKGISFGVQNGECFGLLGVNGAGKTTVFKILTRYIHPTRGEAMISGNDIFTKGSKVSKHMSYCPQHDILFDHLRPTEHLQLYGKIRGVPDKECKEMADKLIEHVGLLPHVKKQSHALSGGNKRKLNFAISMMDFPDVIFLDEMTTGMDPGARRAAWNCLKYAISKGCVAIITSHSMEECEALCHRIAIMVNGSFRCIGGVQYLKDKFGNNYTVKFQLNNDDNCDLLFSKLSENFENLKIMERHCGYLEIEIPAAQVKLSKLFALIHGLKAVMQITDFSVSQTTLEHVFINMVRDQE